MFRITLNKQEAEYLMATILDDANTGSLWAQRIYQQIKEAMKLDDGRPTP